ncbi:MAG: AraC family transcriptional regulator [Breznakia sp.]
MSNHRYQLKEKKQEKMNMRLLYISQARYDTDWHSIKHMHHFTELFYVIRGSGEFLVDNTRFNVHQDDLIIVNPNVSHTEVGHAEDVFEYIVLGIDGLQFVGDDGKSRDSYSLHNYQEFKHEVLFYLRTLVIEAQEKDENFEYICQNLLEILIMNMIRRTKKKLFFASTKKISKECKFIEQYIDDNFHEDITLEKLSKLTYLNKYYIVHAFKNYKGVSPINYLIAKRIEEAKSLLSTTNYSVSKISDIIGFSSQSYFSQVFKKETNMSPNQYRKSPDNMKNEPDRK